MSDMPETIWASRTIIFDDHTGSGSWLEYRHYPSAGETHEYRRADLPPTLAQALRMKEEALREAVAICKALRENRDFTEDMHIGVLECAVALSDRANAVRAAIEAAMKEATP